MDHIQQEVLRRMETMDQFSHDGRLYYGKWREWWRAKLEDKERLLADFKKTVVNAQKELVNRDK